ncbi:MAG TPA: hypothetical protein VG713_04915 [Pirellulales bacterium]|nr:hypothetical protein [Pirellulales bacterium]
MKRALFAMMMLATVASSFGCSCNRPWWRLCDCGGCGDVYYGDWQEGRPCCCECCDGCGNWHGRSPGYVGQGMPMQGGYVQEGEQWTDQPAPEQTPTVAPLPAPQQAPPQSAPPPAPQAQRSVRARPINGYRRPGYQPRNYYPNQRVGYQAQPRAAQYD